VSPQSMEKIWDKIASHCEGLKQKHLKWCLHFLRTYETTEVLSLKYNTNSKTFSRWIWVVVDLMEENLDEVVKEKKNLQSKSKFK